MSEMVDILARVKALKVEVVAGNVKWRSPSNIALVKYWGKFDGQLPANPSLSFTLSASHTETGLSFEPKKATEPAITFQFEGKSKPDFAERLSKYLHVLYNYVPVLKEFDLEISSSNSFPHSSGIASSASSMSALALCLCSLITKQQPDLLTEKEFKQLASFMARLGSGSACRSIYGGYTVWGKSDHVLASDDLLAVEVNEKIAPVFKNLHDDILIVEKGVKKVSSSAGHALMKGHPFANQRFKLADEQVGRLRDILSNGDVEAFGELVEQEALMLHALMMTSRPSFILFKPETLSVIESVRDFREKTGCQVYFTLDAGANVHLIYPDQEASRVRGFIRSELLVYCENQLYLCDQVGKGPELLQA